ncbi:MAG: LysM peptidoglycan-binding domain-containing protein [Caldilineales bacterium]
MFSRKSLFTVLLLALLLCVPALQVQAQEDATSHTVAAGETLSSIAAAYGITLEALAAANGIANPSLIYVGQILAVPSGETEAEAVGPQAPPQPAIPRTIVHSVRSGDTLRSIAARYGVSLTALAAANHITHSSTPQVGDRLIIPAAASRPAVVRSPGRLKFTVSISQQHCQLWQDNAVLYDWTCSTGRVGSGTQAGTYFVQSKYRNAWGSRWEFYMPYWLGIYWAGGSENGIHGLPYQPGGAPVWANSLGTPVTFGCVLLGEAESALLWEMAYIGMPVEISY